MVWNSLHGVKHLTDDFLLSEQVLPHSTQDDRQCHQDIGGSLPPNLALVIRQSGFGRGPVLLIIPFCSDLS